MHLCLQKFTVEMENTYGRNGKHFVTGFAILILAFTQIAFGLQRPGKTSETRNLWFFNSRDKILFN